MFCIKVLVALITEICFVTFFLTAISVGRFSSWWVCPRCWRSCSVWSCGAWTNPGTSYPKTVLSWAPSVTQRDLLCCEECQHFTKIHSCLFLPLQLFLFELQLQHDSAELHVQVVGSLQFPLVMLTDVQSMPVEKKKKQAADVTVHVLDRIHLLYSVHALKAMISPTRANTRGTLSRTRDRENLPQSE